VNFLNFASKYPTYTQLIRRQVQTLFKSSEKKDKSLNAISALLAYSADLLKMAQNSHPVAVA